jgi:hypothetical protein
MVLNVFMDFGIVSGSIETNADPDPAFFVNVDPDPDPGF